jgi:hypothetical protein
MALMITQFLECLASQNRLLNEIYVTKQKYEEIHRGRKRCNTEDADCSRLAAAAGFGERVCVDNMDEKVTNYAAISLNPMLKSEWHEKVWLGHEEKQLWISTANKDIKEL